ncbi:MAG: hypothetical protein C4341_08215 [Armatimonadota bacterium]
MRMLDICRALTPNTAVFPGDEPFSFEFTMRLDRGDSCNVTCLRGSAHTGTLVDLPLHVLPSPGLRPPSPQGRGWGLRAASGHPLPKGEEGACGRSGFDRATTEHFQRGCNVGTRRVGSRDARPPCSGED